MTDKHEPKTREQLEQEFKELEKFFLQIVNSNFMNIFSQNTSNCFTFHHLKLKELFYDVLKRIN